MSSNGKKTLEDWGREVLPRVGVLCEVVQGVNVGEGERDQTRVHGKSKSYIRITVVTFTVMTSLNLR